MMVTIPNKDFKSSQSLASLLYAMSKEYMVKIANRLDLYVSPNIVKAKMASRLAEEILENPLEVVSRLSRSELLLLEEFINAGPNTFIVKKMRKSQYMLQKWCLVMTYEDMENEKWEMLMPDKVRESLASVVAPYIALAKEGKKGPTAKEVRMFGFMSDLLGHSDFTIIGNTVINNRTQSPDNKIN